MNTFKAVALTFVATSLAAGFGLRKITNITREIDEAKFKAGILCPLIKATESINSDLREGNNETAKEKIEAVDTALKDLNETFHSFEFSGLSDLNEDFQKIENQTRPNKSH
ncbi:hypothetical protein [Cerasicoccus maritimus]|uniref:hypothetical protein n=1 Tax=Cerasicoccus maritimus TaxID=490089 RepID=UPI00285269D4|nr:hypothetical protein [Cerasicoccus maritimus]